MRILGGSASRPSPRTSLFATRSFPAREGDHGPLEEPIELSSGGEADHRRPPVLRSDRFGGLRPVGKLQSQIPGFLRVLRGTIDRRLADTCYEMAEMAAAGILDAYSRELPDHLADASPVVRALVERTNETAKSELKDLVHELTTDYKTRTKSQFALGRRKYERMIFAEHLAHIPLERLSEVGHSDMTANQTAFRETAKKID